MLLCEKDFDLEKLFYFASDGRASYVLNFLREAFYFYFVF